MKHVGINLRPSSEPSLQNGDRTSLVMFLYNRDRSERATRLARGEGPDEMFYGLPYVDGDRMRADYLQRHPPTQAMSATIWRPLERMIARSVGMGFALDFVWRHRSLLRAADVIVTTADVVGLPVALLKRWGVIRGQVLYVSQGLSDRLADVRKGQIVRRCLHRWYGQLLKTVDRVLVFGQGARSDILSVFTLSPDKVFYVPFGIDSRFWTPGECEPSEDYVLSVGSDLARDYGTLIEAIGKKPLKIVTRLQVPTSSTASKVHVDSTFTDVELRDLYRGARFIVTPLHDVTQPSGQSATLQAMACGKTVILTQTRGLWDPRNLQDGRCCVLVPPGDPRSLAATMQRLWSNPEECQRIGRTARRMVEETCSSQHLGQLLRGHISELLEVRQ